MKISPHLLSHLRWLAFSKKSFEPSSSLRCRQRPCTYPLRTSLLQKRHRHETQNLADIVNNPPQLVSTRRKHGPGLIVLAIIPITAFALGTWQVQRLGWKSSLIAKFEDRLVAPPLPLPPQIDPKALPDFDYRRVYATGTFRHDQEILVGPRTHDGQDGYHVVTPLERRNGSKILVARGWIAKEFRQQSLRGKASLPKGEVTVAGLLREPFMKNMFTPANVPEKSQWYFPDVAAMANATGSTAVWIEETMLPDLIESMDRQASGRPIGRPAEVNLRNNHTQYIFTWYSLAIATSVMFYMVVKRPATGVGARVRKNIEW